MASRNESLKPQVYAASRKVWRSWLRQNHAKATEAWLVYYKKHTKKLSITYPESVEEALCFGWIDGIRKRIDDERYCQRFTPRRPGSNWSQFNIKLARRLITEGKMTPTGLAVFEQRVADNETSPGVTTGELTLTSELERVLKAKKKAWANFNKLAPGYRRQYIGWLLSAKRPETREKRLREALELLAANKKLGMK